MTEQNTVETTVEEKAKPGRKPAKVKYHNNSARPITLIANTKSGGRVTILPTQTVEVDKAFDAEIKKNAAAMTFFETGDLTEV